MATYTTVDLSLGPFTVPAGVSEVTLVAAGADGGVQAGVQGGGFGSGWEITGTFAVSAGQVIAATRGLTTSSTAGGSPDGKTGNGKGAGGGGKTTITIDAVARLIGAAGGGAGAQQAGSDWYTSAGGNGGWPNGGPGSGSATGGTQTADGTGTLGTNGGGGAGGFFRGGSGSTSKGGAGGSCWADPVATGVSAKSAPRGGTPANGYAKAIYRNPVTPPAPTIIAPTAGGAAAAGTVRMSWAYGGEDTQAGASVEWRVSGGAAGAPATITDATPYTEQTLTPGDWEWRANNTSQDGLTGPWSPWTPFHVETKPATPVITSPADGATLTDVPVPIAWTGTAAAWQAQIVGPTGAIIWDSGTQAGTATSTTGQATVNNITAVVRVRVRATYVYSDWAQATCPVAWIGPVAPVVHPRPDPDTGSIVVEWTQPATSVAIDHYRIDVTENGIRWRVPGLGAIPATHRGAVYSLPRSDTDTMVHVVAVAASGVETSGNGF